MFAPLCMHSQVYSNVAAATASPGSITGQEHNSEAALFVLAVFGLLIMEGAGDGGCCQPTCLKKKEEKCIPKAMQIQVMPSLP